MPSTRRNANGDMAREIAAGVHCLGPKGRTQTHVYFVRSGESWGLIDAGWHRRRDPFSNVSRERYSALGTRRLQFS